MLNTIASQDPPTPSHAGPLTEPIAHMMDPDPATRWTMADAARALHEVGTETRGVDRQEDPTQCMAAATEPARPKPPDTVPKGLRALPAAPAPRRRTPLLVAAVLVLALAAIGGWWLTRGPDDGGTATPGDSSSRTPSSKPSHSASGSGSGGGTSPGGASGGTSGGATDQPSQTHEPSATSEPGGDSTPVSSTADTAADFVTDYYSLLPDETDAAWSMLSPEAQQDIGRGTFDGFWATIDSVSVDGAEAVDDIVEVSLTYTTDGRTEHETRQLQVDQSDDGYLISADLGAV